MHNSQPKPFSHLARRRAPKILEMSKTTARRVPSVTLADGVLPPKEEPATNSVYEKMEPKPTAG